MCEAPRQANSLVKIWVKSGTNIKLTLHCNNQDWCNGGTGTHPTMHNTYRRKVEIPERKRPF